MEKEEFRQFQTSFKAGEKAGKVYLLVRGSVGIFLPDNDSKDPNFLIGENEIFGEMGVIDIAPRMATAKALEESVIIFVSTKEFEKKLEASDMIIRGVMAILSERLRDIQKRR